MLKLLCFLQPSAFLSLFNLSVLLVFLFFFMWTSLVLRCAFPRFDFNTPVLTNWFANLSSDWRDLWHPLDRESVPEAGSRLPKQEGRSEQGQVEVHSQSRPGIQGAQRRKYSPCTTLFTKRSYQSPTQLLIVRLFFNIFVTTQRRQYLKS